MKPIASKNIMNVVYILIIALSTLTPGCKKDDEQNLTPNLQVVAENLVSPLSVLEAPDDSKRLFIVDQSGKVFIVPSGGTMSTTPFLDLSSKIVALNPAYDERGLLSIAFHPSF